MHSCLGYVCCSVLKLRVSNMNDESFKALAPLVNPEGFAYER